MMMPMDEVLRHHNALSIAESLGLALWFGLVFLGVLYMVDRSWPDKGGKRVNK